MKIVCFFFLIISQAIIHPALNAAELNTKIEMEDRGNGVQLKREYEYFGGDLKEIRVSVYQHSDILATGYFPSKRDEVNKNPFKAIKYQYKNGRLDGKIVMTGGIVREAYIYRNGKMNPLPKSFVDALNR
ncbi:hypothetical protein [Melaminivora jejuensis]|uniref:hypothetical protein n=1 Tax=Melaminivora jejuensis TaxID=1267217 RepID=UPI001AE0D4B6|nr:hypothetical protein [Melaminivora jejuensis]UHJ63497.1 hypothetical protein LVC68_08545 [Melaminivora jejuensis]